MQLFLLLFPDRPSEPRIIAHFAKTDPKHVPTILIQIFNHFCWLAERICDVRCLYVLCTYKLLIKLRRNGTSREQFIRVCVCVTIYFIFLFIVYYVLFMYVQCRYITKVAAAKNKTDQYCNIMIQTFKVFAAQIRVKYVCVCMLGSIVYGKCKEINQLTAPRKLFLV